MGVLKLKGNVTALKAKEKEVKHDIDQVNKFVPKNYQAAPLGQFKKDLSDIQHMIKEAEAAKKENETKEMPSAAEILHRHANSDAQKNVTSAENAAKGTALLARTELLTVIDAKVDEIKDKIKAVKKREADIKKYVPAAYRASAL